MTTAIDGYHTKILVGILIGIFMTIFNFHLTQDLKNLVNFKLLQKGYEGAILDYVVPDYCKCGGFLGLDHNKATLVNKDGYADYILTCYACNKTLKYKKYCNQDLPKHYMWVKGETL